MWFQLSAYEPIGVLEGMHPMIHPGYICTVCFSSLLAPSSCSPQPVPNCWRDNNTQEWHCSLFAPNSIALEFVAFFVLFVLCALSFLLFCSCCYSLLLFVSVAVVVWLRCWVVFEVAACYRFRFCSLSFDICMCVAFHIIGSAFDCHGCLCPCCVHPVKERKRHTICCSPCRVTMKRWWINP